MENWKRAARLLLMKRMDSQGGCAYREGSASSAEPTALAALALSIGGPDEAARKSALSAASWLASAQRGDGSLGIGLHSPDSPGWMTAYAMLVWAALNAKQEASRRATRWLLDLKGETIDPRDDPQRIAGHDTMIVGWPWVRQTHSWLEPTALAVLALGRVGQGSHPRVQEGLRLIRDRAIESGGWNYGNKAVFGRSLRPQPGPTGLALLALAGNVPRSSSVDRGIGYLSQVLPELRAPVSLSWGLIGLSAWNERAWDTEGSLRGAFLRVKDHPDAAMKVACLLLAASPDSLALFGRETTALHATEAQS